MSAEPTIATEAVSPDAAHEVTAIEAAARGEIKAPEDHSAAEVAAREPIRLPESSQSVGAVAAENPAPLGKVMPLHTPLRTSNAVSPEDYAQAEKNLAAYFGTKLDPALTKGLLLTLTNMLSDGPDGKLGGTDLKLCFRGSGVQANFAEMQREIIHALHDHPAIKSFFRNHSTVNIDQVTSDDMDQMLHLHLPNMTPAEYVLLIQALAHNTVPLFPTHGIQQQQQAGHGKMHHKEEVVPSVAAQESAPITPPAPQKQEGIQAAGGEVETPVIKDPVIKEPVIQAPVIKEPVITPPVTGTKEEVAIAAAPQGEQKPAGKTMPLNPPAPAVGEREAEGRIVPLDAVAQTRTAS